MDHSEWDRILPIDPFANALHNSYAIYGLILLIYGTSAVVFNQRLFINEAILAIPIGIMIGPQILNLFSPNDYFGTELDHSLLEISRFIVAINCLNVGITLPKKYFWNKKIDLMMVLGPIMGGMFLAASVGVRVILGYSWINSLILGAILTPTDPVLVGTILNGKFAEKYIPNRVRDLLAAESAANDALGFCFLYLPFYIDRHTTIGNQIGLYLLKITLYQIILGSLIGYLIGYATSRILQFSRGQGWIERKAVLCLLIALNFFMVGILTRLGMDEIVGCLFAGVGLAWDDWFVEEMEGSELIEILDVFFNAGYFLFLGSLVSLEKIALIGWGKLVLLSLWIIFIRRIPAALSFSKWIPSIKSRKDEAIVAWFAPVGAGAVLYTQICSELKTEMQDELLQIVLFVVIACILLQGGSIPLFRSVLTDNDADDKKSLDLREIIDRKDTV